MASKGDQICFPNKFSSQNYSCTAEESSVAYQMNPRSDQMQMAWSLGTGTKLFPSMGRDEKEKTGCQRRHKRSNNSAEG